MKPARESERQPRGRGSTEAVEVRHAQTEAASPSRIHTSRRSRVFWPHWRLRCMQPWLHLAQALLGCGMGVVEP